MLKPTLFVMAAGALAVSLAAAAPRGALTASLLAAQQAPPPATEPGQAMPSNMTDMMKHHHEMMMAEMKTADATLEQLAAQMNAATGDAKVAAMAAVVNELVRQQQAMHEHMAQMPMMMMMMMDGRGMMNR